jgi:hypothetical protein
MLDPFGFGLSLTWLKVIIYIVKNSYVWRFGSTIAPPRFYYRLFIFLCALFLARYNSDLLPTSLRFLGDKSSADLEHARQTTEAFYQTERDRSALQLKRDQYDLRVKNASVVIGNFLGAIYDAIV